MGLTKIKKTATGILTDLDPAQESSSPSPHNSGMSTSMAPPHRRLEDHTEPLSSLLDALCDARRFDHPVEGFKLLETHISYVLLTGPYAYKFKKPVDFGFVNFATLERRKYYCEQELRLNRRLAPEMYLDVVAVTGSHEDPALAGSGPVVEYAVKMRQFDPAAQLDQVAARGGLRDEHIDAVCEQVAGLHAEADSCGPDRDFGTTAQIRAQTLENFVHLAGLPEPSAEEAASRLRTWSRGELDRLEAVFEQRRRLHRVKECHGDLHLANMALHDGGVVIFDCIEFNESLRWCDVMSEAAFFYMDLDYRQEPRLARRFLNAYLERSGDYDGLAVWRFYLVYRALVRAKVAHLRAQQGDTDAERSCSQHLALAQAYAFRAHCPSLVITHGLSGSGKTTVTRALLERTPNLLRVRSDIERKRLIGLPGDARTYSALGEGAYSAELTSATYERLAELAEAVLATNHSIVVDATFLRHGERERFARLASRLGVAFRILDIQAETSVLEQRLVERNARQEDAAEADVAVLHAQLASREPLTESECELSVRCDTGSPLDAKQLADALGVA